MFLSLIILKNCPLLPLVWFVPVVVIGEIFELIGVIVIVILVLAEVVVFVVVVLVFVVVVVVVVFVVVVIEFDTGAYYIKKVFI